MSRAWLKHMIHNENSSLLKELGAYAVLVKVAGEVKTVYSLMGRLLITPDNWGLISVPNAIGKGAFDALAELGTELPSHKGKPYNAHITVLRPEEIAKIGGPKRVSERGHLFRYTLGPVMEVSYPKGWSDVAKVWAIQVKSPELSNFRKSYGLSSLPNEDHDFHITFAIRRKAVFLPGDTVTKSAKQFEFSGNVQHVGLRSAIHKLLDQKQLPGIAFNDPVSGKVTALLPTDDNIANETIQEVQNFLRNNPEVNGDFTITEQQEKPIPFRRVYLDEKKTRDLFTKWNYSSWLNDPDFFQAAKKHLMDRYRLFEDLHGNLTGDVPEPAYNQLTGENLAYKES